MKKIVIVSLLSFLLGIGSAFVFQSRREVVPPSPIGAGEAACRVDGDCQLIKSERLSQCCVTGDQCGSLDYSQPNWVAVNVEWFTRKRQAICPKEKEYRECGSPPGCAVELDRRYQARCVNNLCDKVRVALEGTITGGQVVIGAQKPNGLSSYPDLPLGNLDLSKPLSVRAVVEHRMALNEMSVMVKGFVVSTLLGEAACGSGGNKGACAQPRIILADTTENGRDINYDLTVLLSETEQGYAVGQDVTVTGIVFASKEAVVVQKT